MYTILKICILYDVVCIYVPHLRRYILYIHDIITYIGLISIHLTVIPCLCVLFLPKSHGCHKTYPESPSETGTFQVDPNLHALAEGEVGVFQWDLLDVRKSESDEVYGCKDYKGTIRSGEF